MPGEPIIFHWDPEDDPDGNWQHVFEGHDVEQDEVEEFIQDYLGVSGACVHRDDDSGSGLLRPRTAAPGLRTRRSGQGVMT